MSTHAQSAVILNILENNPEFKQIANAVIQRIQDICNKPSFEKFEKNGITYINFLNLFVLGQKTAFKGYISTNENQQYFNLINKEQPTNLPTWQAHYVDTSKPSKIELPLDPFQNLFLPISIIYSLSSNDQSQVKNYVISAVLRQIIQEQPELFHAPMRSTFFASMYIHYCEQLLQFKCTTINELPFHHFKTEALDQLCNQIDETYRMEFLDRKLFNMFCYFSPLDVGSSNLNIHEQYIVFANTYGFAKNQLNSVFVKNPFTYALSLIYTKFTEASSNESFKSFCPVTVIGQELYNQISQSKDSLQKAFLNTMLYLNKNKDISEQHGLLHNLYLDFISNHPYECLTLNQIKLHYSFLVGSTHLHCLTTKQFALVLLSLGKATQTEYKQFDNDQSIVAVKLNQLVKFAVMNQNQDELAKASAEDIHLLTGLKQQNISLNLSELSHRILKGLLRPFWEFLDHPHFEAYDCSKPATIEYSVSPFNYTCDKTKIKLELQSSLNAINATLKTIKVPDSLIDSILNRTRSVFSVVHKGKNFVLIVDTKTKGFKYLFESLVSPHLDCIPPATEKSVHLALQKINFG